MKRLLKLTLLFFPALAAAQNICTNGGFESYTTLPSTYAQTCLASGWYSPSGTCALIAGTGSPDYYNRNGSGGAATPNTWWATVSPHTGNGIMGFVTYYPSGNYREYVERQLSSAMTPGIPYTVSFWITNGVSTLHNNGTNNIGAYFSLNSITQSTGSPILVTPQVRRTTVFYSTTWQQMSFVFTPTQAFRYITIGNFYNDAATTVGVFGANPNGAYYYLDDVIVEPMLILPVELTAFTAKKAEEGNLLEWETASELNSKSFIIESSNNGEDFDSIGIVAAQGNSTTLSDYSFMDFNPYDDITYYRLKQLDNDGSFTYSKIVFIKERSAAFTLVAGNNGMLSIKPAGKEVQLNIYSISGAHILQSEIYTAEDVDISHLAKGIYIVKATDGEKIFAEKMLIK